MSGPAPSVHAGSRRPPLTVGGSLFVLGLAVVTVLVFASLCTFFMRAHDKAHDVTCFHNQRSVSLALLEYEQDNNGYLPDAAHWMDRSSLYARAATLYDCPDAPGPRFGYAFNSRLSGRNYQTLDSATDAIMLYDSRTLAANAHDSVTTLPSPGRHTGHNNVTYADGHTHACPVGQAPANRAVASPD